jgi:hypothetical protein
MPLPPAHRQFDPPAEALAVQSRSVMAYHSAVTSGRGYGPDTPRKRRDHRDVHRPRRLAGTARLLRATALQSGVLDGQENPLTNIYSAKLHTITRIGHQYQNTPVVAGPPDEVTQPCVRSAVDEAGAFQRQLSLALTNSLQATMEEGEAIFTEVADRQVFIDATASVYETYAERCPSSSAPARSGSVMANPGTPMSRREGMGRARPVPRPIAGISSLLETSGKVIAALFLVIMFAALLADVVLRYAFASGMPWAYEIHAILLPWAVAGGVVVASGRTPRSRIVKALAGELVGEFEQVNDGRSPLYPNCLAAPTYGEARYSQRRLASAAC